MSSADNFCKQSGPRSGPTLRRAWSGSKLFDTLMIFLKNFFGKKIFWKKSADDNTAWKITHWQGVNKKIKIAIYIIDVGPDKRILSFKLWFFFLSISKACVSNNAKKKRLIWDGSFIFGTQAYILCEIFIFFYENALLSGGLLHGTILSTEHDYMKIKDQWKKFCSNRRAHLVKRLTCPAL